MSGQFFKTLVRRALLAISPSKARRRRPILRHSLERLESRALLSAAGYEIPNIPAEVRMITAETSAPPTSGEAARRKQSNQLFAGGAITIETPVGPVELNGRQRGKRIQGTANLAGIDLAKAGQFAELLGIEVPPFLNLITLPTVKFKGTFQNNQLDASFKTTLKVPLLGNVDLAGRVTGALDLGQGQLIGHLKVTAGGNTVLDQDFVSELPTLPAAFNSRSTPRIGSVAGEYEFQSGGLGDGTLTITQNGQDIEGTIAAPNLASGEFTAHFRSARSRQAKGTVEFLFLGEEVPENDRFFISFFRDGAFRRFRYS